MSKTQLLKVACTFFSKQENNALCKEDIKEFRLFLHCATEVEYKVSFYYLERSVILTSTTLDLFYCLLFYEIGMNNTFASIPQL